MSWGAEGMKTLHSNSDFDPVAKALGLIKEVETEALDEDQVAEVCTFLSQSLASRAQASQRRSAEAYRLRVEDNRRALVQSKQKGVKPAEVRISGGEKPKIIQPAGSVIPSKFG